MFDRDAIFWWATGIFLVSLLLALLVSTYFVYGIILAYLLRPALHSAGLADNYADERQKQIQFHSGNIAFVVLIIAIAVMAVQAELSGETIDTFATLLAIGLATKAIVGVIMVRDYRAAGVQITISLGLIVTAFIVLEAGFSIGTIIGAVIGIMISMVGLIGIAYPRVLGGLLVAVAAAIWVMIGPGFVVALLLPLPLVVAAACLFHSSRGGVHAEYTQSTTLKTYFNRNLTKLLGLGGLALASLALVGQISEKEITKYRTMDESIIAVVEVEGVSCQKGARYYEDGNLKSCVLARKDTLSGQPLPLGTTVHLTMEGTLDWCFLPEDTYIQGHLCKGRGHSWSTAFHPNGRLKLAWLGKDEIIQGIPCAEASFWGDVFGGGAGTYFHDNGNLSRCRLADDIVIEGHAFEKGDHVRLDRDGKLVADAANPRS
ncbi:MAG: hypothetical protein JSU74_11355 [Candidatus Zixiibacteriota bacterium]|nr:MAG: hypothetical protein JSU74_11355 [candidate division Zixibacteria bacterium]